VSSQSNTLREEILGTFGPGVFSRPLFYSYDFALRFALSQGDTPIEQFVSALDRSRSICASALSGSSRLAAVARFWRPVQSDLFALRTALRQLAAAGVQIPDSRSLWEEPEKDSAGCVALNIAFLIDHAAVSALLWCALANELAVKPSPGCDVYLFNLDRKLAVFAYDDRGMDVVSPDLDALRPLYAQHYDKLLDFDRADMDAQFGSA
jgi:hypothetical protein